MPEQIVTRKSRQQHRLRNHQLYTVWFNMKQRCFNPNRHQFKDWGGRGITVYDLWINDFKLFYDWAISNGWEKGLEIDRVDNNGNYTPDNCRFVPKKINNRNQRSNRINLLRAKHIRILFKCGGKTKTEIGRLYGVTETTIRHIISNRQWV